MARRMRAVAAAHRISGSAASRCGVMSSAVEGSPRRPTASSAVAAGDRVLLVCGKGEETEQGGGWRTRETRPAGRRSGSADVRHHRAGPEGRGVRPGQRRTTGAPTTGSQASYRPPPSPSAPAAARARRYPSRRPTAPRTRPRPARTCNATAPPTRSRRSRCREVRAQPSPPQDTRSRSAAGVLASGIGLRNR